jgi:hypothetical protein
LRTFGITAAPEFLALAAGARLSLRVASMLRLPHAGKPWAVASNRNLCIPNASSRSTVPPAVYAGMESDWSSWETPGRQLFAGGRPQPLLESAQKATLTSVATSAFPRQSNSLAMTRFAIANSHSPLRTNGVSPAPALQRPPDSLSRKVGNRLRILPSAGSLYCL